MLNIRIRLVVLSVIASVFVAPAAYAGTTSTLETVATESFEYTAGSNLTGLNGGTGWSGGWNADYGASYLAVDANSLSVTGLTGTGGSAAWGGSFNQVAANGRNLATRQSSGVIWVQVIGRFNQSGGGTPTLRMFDSGNMNYYFAGNINANWSMATASGSMSASSATPVNSGTHIAAYRINMDTRLVEMWTDFNPSTFNYLSPPAAEASMTSDISLAFDRIALYSRPGGVWDELKIMRVTVPKYIAPMLPLGAPKLSVQGDQVTCEAPDYSKEILAVEWSITLDGQVISSVDRKSAPWTVTASMPAKSSGVLRCLVTALGESATGSVASELTLSPASPVIPPAPPVTTGVNSAQCSAQPLALGFRPLASKTRGTDMLFAGPKSSCRLTITVTGYVQPTSFTANDRSLSLARARAAAAVVRQMYPQATIVVKAGLAKRVSACATTQNRCAVVAFTAS